MDIQLVLTTGAISVVTAGITSYIAAKLSFSIENKKFRANYIAPIIESARSNLSKIAYFHATEVSLKGDTLSKEELNQHFQNAIIAFEEEKNVYLDVSPYIDSDLRKKFEESIDDMNRLIIDMCQNTHEDPTCRPRMLRLAILFRPLLSNALDKQLTRLLGK